MSERAPRCEACGMPLLLGQRRMHAMCNRRTIVGKICECRIGCSTTIVGAGSIPCRSDCDVCSVLHGKPYAGARK